MIEFQFPPARGFCSFPRAGGLRHGTQEKASLLRCVPPQPAGQDQGSLTLRMFDFRLASRERQHLAFQLQQSWTSVTSAQDLKQASPAPRSSLSGLISCFLHLLHRWLLNHRCPCPRWCFQSFLKQRLLSLQRCWRLVLTTIPVPIGGPRWPIASGAVTASIAVAKFHRSTHRMSIRPTRHRPIT